MQCKRKIVRDLAWVFTSPHTLSIRGELGILDDEFCQNIVAASTAWLAELDDDADHLISWLAAQSYIRRLGNYFAALIEYWLRFCPLFGGQGDNRQVLLVRQQVKSSRGAVVGQLKYLFSCSLPTELLTPHLAAASGISRELLSTERRLRACLHIECSLKCFMDSREDPPATAAEPIAARNLGNKDPNDEGAAVHRFMGPFLHENMAHRMREMRRKLALAATPSVRRWATDALGGAPTSLCLLRGWMFYPLRLLEQRSADSAGSFDNDPASATSSEQGKERTFEAVGGLSVRHLRGWWTRAPEELQAFAAGRPSSRWAVLKKLSWLSLAEATEGDVPDAGGEERRRDDGSDDDGDDEDDSGSDAGAKAKGEAGAVAAAAAARITVATTEGTAATTAEVAMPIAGDYGKVLWIPGEPALGMAPTPVFRSVEDLLQEVNRTWERRRREGRSDAGIGRNAAMVVELRKVSSELPASAQVNAGDSVQHTAVARTSVGGGAGTGAKWVEPPPPAVAGRCSCGAGGASITGVLQGVTLGLSQHRDCKAALAHAFLAHCSGVGEDSGVDAGVLAIGCIRRLSDGWAVGGVASAAAARRAAAVHMILDAYARATRRDGAKSGRNDAVAADDICMVDEADSAAAALLQDAADDAPAAALANLFVCEILAKTGAISECSACDGNDDCCDDGGRGSVGGVSGGGGGDSGRDEGDHAGLGIGLLAKALAIFYVQLEWRHGCGVSASSGDDGGS
ncbi:unnamed protein product, partial [Phaeothamnion confervicola]